MISDGQFHSGEALGRALGISRSAVWKQLRSLADLDIDIHAVPGKGYRLAQPLELLDEKDIIAHLSPVSSDYLACLEIHQEIDSTNGYLLGKMGGAASRGWACVAECQRQGRGRRGRQWFSPFASNVYLSLLWRFSSGPESLGGLGLVAGVAVAGALQALGLAHVGLKWPNDVLWQGRKLAGILLEMRGESSGATEVVLGVGVNVRMPRHSKAAIDQPWVDLDTAMGTAVSRNRVAGLMLHHMLMGLTKFQAVGLPPFLEAWRQWDMVDGKQVVLQLPDRQVHGIAQGVDSSGALLLASNGVQQRFHAGEVSLRTLT